MAAHTFPATEGSGMDSISAHVKDETNRGRGRIRTMVL